MQHLAVSYIIPMARFHAPARYSSRVGQRLQVALGAAAALAAFSLSPGSAQAYVVTVGGVQYDVTTFTGTYNDNISKFDLPPGGVMPWWGNSILALQFANAVGTSLGLLNETDGPYFAFSPTIPTAPTMALFVPPSTPTTTGAYPFQTFTYAKATPVPGPLPLLCAALPLSFCRHLRSRSKRLRHGAIRLA